MKRKNKIKSHDIKSLYREFKSVDKVAEVLGVSRSTIYNYISKYDIDLEKNRFPYSKKELVALHEEYGSITKVAANINRNYSTVRHWYASLGIVFNTSGMTVFQEIRNTDMTDLQKSAVIGSMLGDGGLWLAPHTKNARLYISHCEKQLQYLKWLHSIFNPFSRAIKQTEKAGKKIICGREVNNSNFYRFYTIAHPYITSVFKQYYRNGVKGLDNSIVDKVDLLAMAIWFGDDGTIQRGRDGLPYMCNICTNSFTYKEHLILVDIVKKFFAGTISIKTHGSIGREDYMLRMNGKQEVIDFLELIKTILPECIHYKLS